MNNNQESINKVQTEFQAIQDRIGELRDKIISEQGDNRNAKKIFKNMMKEMKLYHAIGCAAKSENKELMTHNEFIKTLQGDKPDVICSIQYDLYCNGWKMVSVGAI